MKITKLLALLLAVCMLFSLMPMMVSCGDEEGTKDTEKDDGKNDGPVAPEDYTQDAGHTMSGLYGYELKPVDGIDYKGERFNILVPKSEGWVVSRDFASEYSEKGSDVIQDAAYERVLAVNGLYNTEINAITTKSNVASEAQNDIEGQLGTFDLILCDVTSVGSLSIQHLLADLTEFDGEEIQLDAPWYNQNFVDNMSIGGRLFYVIGDFSIIDNEGITAIQFNMDLFDEYDLGNPYTMVYDGTWTVDAMHALCKGRVNDYDGSGSIDQYDEFGLLAGYSNIIFFMTGGACFVAQKDESDLPYLSLNNSRTLSMLDKMLDMFYDSTSSVDFSTFTKDSAVPNATEYCNKVFMEDRCLMRQVAMYRVTQTRSMTSDFGFLPMPKYDQSQEEYYHMYSSASPAVAIPSYMKPGRTVSDAAAVMEALSYYGRTILLYQYYDVVMKGRIARDQDSRKVLDIIFDASYFDIGACNNFGKINSVFYGSATGGSNMFSSDYDALKSSAESAIEEYVESWSKFLSNT